MKHMKKRVAALLLTLAMVLSLAPMAFAADEFPDMPAEDDPSYAAVKSAVDNAIMTGENGELNLEGTILRSTVAKMVVTAFAAKGEADLSGYPDVMDGAWYASWMAKANQMGIMTGTSGKMNPGSEVTLAEVAAMLCRALGLSVDEDATVEGVAVWAAPYVKALIDAKYITAEDAAAAHEPMTRGAFAEVIYKVSGEGNYAKEENAEITEDVNGNIVITANGVSLKGITVKGDIIIADGVDAGSVVLDGVKVEGRIVVRGAGAELTNGTTASSTVVAATTGEATVKADDGSDAGDIAVAGTNGMAADKVVIDMAEPKVTVTTATEVAVQNAEGGEITLQAPNASLSVESGTVANVTVADGASGVKVDVAEGATIDKVTTNTDLAVTGEGTVTEKAGSGTVTDGSGNEVAGSDEPVEVPTVEEPAPEVDPNAPTNPTHTHNYTGGTVAKFDATRHTIQCVGTPAVGTEGQPGYVAAVPCSAVIYEEHSYTIACKANGDVSDTASENVTTKCVCGQVKPADPTVAEDKSGINAEKKECGTEGASATSHTWVADDSKTNVTLTCTVDGVVYEKCSTCGMKRTTTTPKTGHNLTPFKTVAPTCGTAGKTYFKCTNKGCTMDGSDWENETPSKTTVQEIPATGAHKWVLSAGKYDPEHKPTCTDPGKYLYECANGCGQTDKTKDAPALGHNFTIVTAVENDDTHHKLKCSNADCDVLSDLVACTFQAGITGAKPATPATCEAPGETATLACACGNTTGGDEISQLDHKYSTEWTANGETGHYHACLNGCDNKENGAEAHKWSAYVLGEDGQPTTTPAPDAVCTVCHYRHTAGGSTGPAAHTHTPSNDWSHNETGHWKQCTDDNCPSKTDPTQQDSYATHDLSSIKRDQKCTCGADGTQAYDAASCPKKDVADAVGHGTNTGKCPLCDSQVS